MAMAHCHGVILDCGLDHLCRFGSVGEQSRFARLFPHLPPLYISPDELASVGREGGPMDDRGNLRPTRAISAGLIFFGQFIDHDLTLDTTSLLSESNVPERIENARTPALDLDSVYGGGPERRPYLYLDKEGQLQLLTGNDFPANYIQNWLAEDDLPRVPNGRAIIGDPRNDENRIISQMHLGFLRFHNLVARQGKSFEDARRIVTWHYQWIVVNEFLREICGSWVVDDVLANGRKLYRPEQTSDGRPFIPIEFAAAVYRFGHAMVPNSLRIQPGQDQHELFDPNGVLGVGFEPLTDPRAVVDWSALLPQGNQRQGANDDYERASRLEPKLATALLNLPFIDQGESSLAVRNLLRGQSFLLPSGEQVAEAMRQAGATEISENDIARVRAAGSALGFRTATPLWIYVLAEGATIGRRDEGCAGVLYQPGEGLGPLGARLVAEVIIGLLELDEQSYLGANRNWSPLGEDQIGEGVTTLYQLLTASKQGCA